MPNFRNRKTSDQDVEIEDPSNNYETKRSRQNPVKAARAFTKKSGKAAAGNFIGPMRGGLRF